MTEVIEMMEAYKIKNIIMTGDLFQLPPVKHVENGYYFQG